MSDVPGGDGGDRKPPSFNGKRKWRGSIAGPEKSAEQSSTAASSATSRARVRPDISVDERVDHCWRLMADGQWDGYATRRELAELWGVSLETIKAHSSEASRRLKLTAEDLAAARSHHAHVARQIQAMALGTMNCVTGMYDLAAALKANEQAAAFRGCGLDVEVQPQATERPVIEIHVLPPVVKEEP